MECSTCDYYWPDPATVCGGVCSHLRVYGCDFEPSELGCGGFGEDGILADTPYRLDESGSPVEGIR